MIRPNVCLNITQNSFDKMLYDVQSNSTSGRIEVFSHLFCDTSQSYEVIAQYIERCNDSELIAYIDYNNTNVTIIMRNLLIIHKETIRERFKDNPLKKFLK